MLRVIDGLHLAIAKALCKYVSAYQHIVFFQHSVQSVQPTVTTKVVHALCSCNGDLCCFTSKPSVYGQTCPSHSSCEVHDYMLFHNSKRLALPMQKSQKLGSYLVNSHTCLGRLLRSFVWFCNLLVAMMRLYSGMA